MSNIVLREAVDADASVILAVRRAANEEYRYRPDGPSGAFSDTVEGTCGMMATVPVVVAVADNRIVGCVFYAREADHCDLFRLAVLPTYQRQGIGRALIEYVEARTVEMGLPCVHLGVRRGMPQNVPYYERLGYRVTETTKTGWKMEKTLSGA